MLSNLMGGIKLNAYIVIQQRELKCMNMNQDMRGLFIGNYWGGHPRGPPRAAICHRLYLTWLADRRG